MKFFYTYELIDSRNNTVFYVGKGTGARMYQHYYAVIKNNKPLINTKLQNKIKSIFKNNGIIIYNQIIAITEQAAFDKEIELIKQHKINNIDLCNLTNGGEGISGHHFNHTQATKDKLSIALKDKPKSKEHINNLILAKIDNPNNTKFWKNKKFSSEHKNSLSDSAKLKPKMSEYTKSKISENSQTYLNIGKTHEEIYGIEKSQRMLELNRLAHLNKHASIDTKNKMSIAQLGVLHPKAKIYIINDNGNIYEEKSTLKILSTRLNLKICTIRNIIKNNLVINNINIKIK